MESDTLRKIQVKHGHGLAGSFKDRTIAEWLQVHNPTELDYQKVCQNLCSVEKILARKKSKTSRPLAQDAIKFAVQHLRLSKVYLDFPLLLVIF